MAGVLVLVVGPSGAGKDTLIGRARQALAGDSRFSFPRRIVTRPAVAALEDHETVGPDAFAARLRAGDFALSWAAHGLSYALPRTIDADIAAGRIVVANGSRRVLGEALARYPGLRVFLVTAPPEVLARRLAERGRETTAEIMARLAREEPPLPTAVRPVVIDNSGTPEAAVRRFLAALTRLTG